MPAPFTPVRDDACPRSPDHITTWHHLDTGARLVRTPYGPAYVQGEPSYRMTCLDCGFSERRSGHPLMYRS
jgi:hypothetical protein